MADQATFERLPALPSVTVPVKACLYMRAKCFQAAVGFLSRILTVGLKHESIKKRGAYAA